MTHKFEKIHIIICLLASLAVTVCSLIYTISLTDAALRLILTIVIFYIVGSMIKMYLLYRVFPDESVSGDAEQEQEQEQEELDPNDETDAELYTFDGSSDIDDEI